MFSTSQAVSKPGQGVWRSLPMNAKDYLPTVAAACILILLFAMESWLPAVAGRHRRLRHAARNLALGLLNAAAVAGCAPPFVSQVAGGVGVGGLWCVDSVRL